MKTFQSSFTLNRYGGAVLVREADEYLEMWATMAGQDLNREDHENNDQRYDSRHYYYGAPRQKPPSAKKKPRKIAPEVVWDWDDVIYRDALKEQRWRLLAEFLNPGHKYSYSQMEFYCEGAKHNGDSPEFINRQLKKLINL